MSLFESKESKEVKKQQEIQKYMEQHGIDNLNEKDIEAIHKIVKDLTGYINVGELARNKHLGHIVEQNWIIIRKLDEISNKLNK